jgi:hypothetical protein
LEPFVFGSRLLPEQQEVPMLYRGIEYDIKVGIEKQWIWVVHTPMPKQGRVIGLRTLAVIAAQKAIDEWCHKHPQDCGVRPPFGTGLF